MNSTQETCNRTTRILSQEDCITNKKSIQVTEQFLGPIVGLATVSTLGAYGGVLDAEVNNWWIKDYKSGHGSFSKEGQLSLGVTKGAPIELQWF